MTQQLALIEAKPIKDGSYYVIEKRGYKKCIPLGAWDDEAERKKRYSGWRLVGRVNT